MNRTVCLVSRDSQTVLSVRAAAYAREGASGRSIDMVVIRLQLGHASMLTTFDYLDHFETESTLETFAKRG